MTDVNAPLAERMRPLDFGSFVGQEEIVGNDGSLRRLIDNSHLISFLLWGPPGTGKTTIARIVSQKTSAFFQTFSAVTSSITDLRKRIREAEVRWKMEEKKTIIFVDEIHHFNKSQQDAFLPHIESGKIVFIGATTENPSFTVNSALLSRLKVFVLEQLKPEHVEKIVAMAITDKEKGLGLPEDAVEVNVIKKIAALSYGDARVSLNILEAAYLYVGRRGEITLETIEKVIKGGTLYYDKTAEEHYNLISALHKSLRDSDVDSALYWCYRMLEGGERPLYILRRLVRFASEDIGLADPKALTYTLAAKDAFEFLGPPEGFLAILQAVVYLGAAPKSNAVYQAEKLIKKDIKEYGHLPVPMVIRNAPTGLMKNLGYGDHYQYAHDAEDAIVNQAHMPDLIGEKQYYFPVERGLEKKLKEYLFRLKERKKRKGTF